jgi:metal-responsive CopG/Arc/MetJ family transcriptional regulator
MEHLISVNIPDELRESLDRIAKREGLTPDELVRKSVSNYLFISELRAFQEEFIPYARKKGIQNDEDVFNLVS